MKRIVVISVIFSTLLLSIKSGISQPEVLWSQTYGITDTVHYYGQTLLETENGFLVGGFRWDLQNQTSASIMKFDPAGESVWFSPPADTNLPFIAHHIIETHDGSFAATGSIVSQEGMWIERLTPDGARIVRYNNYYSDETVAIMELSTYQFAIVHRSGSYHRFYRDLDGLMGTDLKDRNHHYMTDITSAFIQPDGNLAVFGMFEGNKSLIKFEPTYANFRSVNNGNYGEHQSKLSIGGYIACRNNFEQDPDSAWLDCSIIDDTGALVEIIDRRFRTGSYFVSDDLDRVNGGLYFIENSEEYPSLIKITTDGEVVWSLSIEASYPVVSIATSDVGFLTCSNDWEAGTMTLTKFGTPGTVPPPLSLIPQPLSLSAFPNPFNSSTTISYSLPRPGRYSIDVIDIQGRIVTRLSDRWREAGSYREVLHGAKIPAGYYQVSMQYNRTHFTKSVLLIK